MEDQHAKQNFQFAFLGDIYGDRDHRLDQLIALASKVPRYATNLLQTNIYRLTIPRAKAVKWRHVLAALAPPKAPVDDTLVWSSGAVDEALLRDITETRPHYLSRETSEKLARARSNSPAFGPARRLLHTDIASGDGLIAEPVGLNADAEQLKRRVRDFGISTELNELLTKIEVGLGLEDDAFDQAAHLEHLRTFFEHLHRALVLELQRRRPETKDDTPLRQCETAIDYLARQGVLTDPLKDLAWSIYNIVSEEGVKGSKAEREHVRLCWSAIVEYGKILFVAFERRLTVR